MNLVLFDAAELTRPLPRDDRRARHILDVLRRRVGDTFDAALINGRRGKATVASITEASLTLTFAWHEAEAPPAAESRTPLTLIVGLSRPQTARDILRDVTTLGVAAIHFVRTEKSEPSYAQSTLWSSGEWRRHVIAGAEQAFDPCVPEVTHGRPLAELVSLQLPATTRLALDNYGATTSLSHYHPSDDKPVVLAIGAERGWSEGERQLLREHDFTLVHLGVRVLRTETACIATLSILRAKLGLM